MIQNIRSFFQKFTVTGANFNSDGYQFGFVSNGLILSNEGETGNIVEYSFDGIHVHGELDPSAATKCITCPNRQECVIFLRLKDGTSAIVRVEAWA